MKKLHRQRSSKQENPTNNYENTIQNLQDFSQLKHKCNYRNLANQTH